MAKRKNLRTYYPMIADWDRCICLDIRTGEIEAFTDSPIVLRRCWNWNTERT